MARWRSYLLLQAAIAAMCFALAWLWVAAAPMAYMDPEYPVWRAKLAMLRRCDLGRLLIVGDSRAAVDVIPALLPVPVTNLAVGGGMPVETYIAVKRALTCPVPPRRVVISLDAAHFVLPDLFWERSVGYGFAGAPDLAVLHRVIRETGDVSLSAPKRPDGLPFWLRARLYAWRFPSLYFASLAKGGVFLRLWRNQATLARTLAARGQYFFGRDAGSSAVASEGYMADFAPLPVLDRYFDRTLALLAARGIPVDFVAMPMNEATAHAVRPDIKAAFGTYLARYAARYPNFHVIGLPMPAWPNRWFGDEFSHLNPQGAALFSARFAECLRQLLASTSSAANPATSPTLPAPACRCEKRSDGVISVTSRYP
ncbi:MAG TPA: hypothetical protein VMU81_22310 [Acetobacteraceae bacterium]|nr:hypothetical protein [Acetobacteraceae bacterium]